MEEKERYDTHNNSIDDLRYVEYFNKFLKDSVFPFVKEIKKGLDFGSGPTPVLAKILEKNYGINMDIYDFHYAPEKSFKGNKYDLITSTEVVEHLKEPLEEFRLFESLLKENGILAVMTQFHRNNHEEFVNWHYTRDRTHISFFTPKTMKYIANITGLEIIYNDSIKCTTFRKAYLL